MKIAIETGRESHSTSSANVQAKFANGPYEGKNLYEQKQYQLSKEWETDKHKSWVQAVYDLLEGTEIEIIGRGVTGARGAEKHSFHRVYRLDASVDVQEVLINVGLRECLLKGRVTLVEDLLLAQETKKQRVYTEGF